VLVATQLEIYDYFAQSYGKRRTCPGLALMWAAAIFRASDLALEFVE
jgi:hypothetical protein